jgi:hypothetical protein
MFVSDEAALDIGFDLARARLAALTESGALTRASADAYAAIAPPGSPWLARSCFRDLIARPGRAVLAVRWETGGHPDELFPVLDADLTLTAAGPRAALLQLAGVCRTLNGATGHQVAAVAAGGFLSRIADTITRPGDFYGG